jgi:hypothetical protein
LKAIRTSFNKRDSATQTHSVIFLARHLPGVVVSASRDAVEHLARRAHRQIEESLHVEGRYQLVRITCKGTMSDTIPMIVICEAVPEMKRIGCVSSAIFTSLSHLIHNTKTFSGLMKGMRTSTIAPTDMNVFSNTTAEISLGCLCANETDTAPPKLRPNAIMELFVNLINR